MALTFRCFSFSVTKISKLNSTLFLRDTKICLCPVTSSIQYRERSRKAWSKFPKEDGVTRIEELGRKLNPTPTQQANNDVPSDHGFKVDSTGQIFSSYVPVEKKKFVLTKKGFAERWEAVKAFVISTYSIALIKRRLKPFKVVDFAKVAQKKFIDINNALQQKEDKKAQMKMKEDATLLVIKGLTRQFHDPSRNVYWRFIKEIDRPRVVHARVSAVFDKDNLYAQLTVRMRSEQILAVRDRHNRLITGDLRKTKHVTDYVVFERHLTDPYGKWRICGKLFQK